VIVDAMPRLWFDCPVRVAAAALILILPLATSCTTLSNRRDLFNPSEEQPMVANPPVPKAPSTSAPVMRGAGDVQPRVEPGE
jgi:hypothetical protein